MSDILDNDHPVLENPREDFFCDELLTRPRPEIGKILVTGASGYIGGRLAPELLARGYQVRAMVRLASPAYEALWPGAEIVVADTLQPESLHTAMKDVHTAYYLIHSLLLGPSKFEEAEIEAAANFRKAAERAHVSRIIYLGGLGDKRSRLSDHLRSRMKVAEELAGSKVPVTFLRAAIIVGSGSASYEIIKHLVKNLFVILIPRWAKNKCQPVAIRDVVKYLVGALETPETTGMHLDIGGVDILTYEEMLKEMAEILGVKRIFLPAPFSGIGFLSYVASLITPVPAAITVCLMRGLANEVVCQDQKARELIPFQPLTYRQSIVKALSREEQDQVHSRWSDAYPPAHELAVKLHELDGPPAYTASYSLVSDKSAAALFRSVCEVGGEEGWFHHSWMWRMRGGIDRLLLGVGSSRGRRSPSKLADHDVIDFWRVEDLQPDRRLLLRAEMKLPGKAWLEFMIQQQGNGNVLSVTAHYETRTLFGHLYWYLMLPFHHFIFTDLIRQIEKRDYNKQRHVR
ncbi:MAG: SDR family oxidoreductase [Syntrophales bacterium]|nr:SDR family oxidoreductase [Syntrophales bacterium]MDP3098541.1 SDR family oxidoreductase [Syntrophales bacterium]